MQNIPVKYDGNTLVVELLKPQIATLDKARELLHAISRLPCAEQELVEQTAVNLAQLTVAMSPPGKGGGNPSEPEAGDDAAEE